MEQQLIQKSYKELCKMSVAELEVYKVKMLLASKKAPTEYEKEPYHKAMELANSVINNKLGGH